MHWLNSLFKKIKANQSSKPRLFQLGFKYPKLVLSVFSVLAFFSLLSVTNLKVDSDLVSFLPKNTPSIQNIDQFKKYFGGTSFLLLTVSSSDVALNEEFADLMVQKITGSPEIFYIDFKRPVDFFKKRQWLYLQKADLEMMQSRVERALELEKQGVSFVFNDYVDFADEEDRPDLTFKDIIEKYKKKQLFSSKVNLSGEDGKFLAVRIKVKSEYTDIEKARQFVSKIQSIETSLKKQDPRFNSIVMGYTGSLKNLIDQNDQVKKEMAQISLIVGVLLGLIFFFYFRNFEAVFLVGIPLVIGIACTGGMTTILLGRLNILTSFAAAILSGLGSDYGIYLLSRYYSERREGKTFEQATQLAFANTGSATYASMLTTVGSFAALLFSSFGFFFEFGMVGAFGILINYVCMVLLMPALLSLWHGNRDRQKSIHGFWHVPSLMSAEKADRILNIVFLKAPKTGIVVSVILMVLALFTLPRMTSIQYQDGLLDNKELSTNRLYSQVKKLSSVSLSPTVVVAPDRVTEKKLNSVFNNLLDQEGEKVLPYKGILSLSSFVPADIETKKVILKQIYKAMSQLKYMPASKKSDVLKSLEDSIQATAITIDDLPQEIKQLFVSPVDPNISAVLLYPSIPRSTKEDLKKYHVKMDEVKQKTGIDFVAADTSFAYDDIFTLLSNESSHGFEMIILFLMAVLLYTSKSIQRSWIVMAHLMGSLIMISGILWFIPMPLNVFNIVAFPIILGTGIDSFIHFAQRFDESADSLLVIKEKVPAILVANLTSIVGFTGLILTSLLGLQSFGWVTTIGLLVVTAVSVLIFPRSLLLEARRNKKKEIL